MSLNFDDAPKPVNKNRKVAPEGTTYARIVQVVDLGVQERPDFQGQEKQPCAQLRLTFELVDELADFGDEEKPFWISKTVNFSNHEKSALTRYRQAINPNAKSVADLVDCPCMVTITHNEYKGATYANITNVTGVPKKTKVTGLHNPTLVIDLDSGDTDAFLALPDWLQTHIRKAINFNETAVGKALADAPAKEEELEDEIPF